MTIKDKTYYIYIRSTKQRIEVTKQQFDDYYRRINAYRRTQQNHGRCTCPKNKRLMCDMDCCSCPYYTCGDISYLDDGLTDDEGNEMNRLDYLQEKLTYLQEPSVENIIINSIELRQILSRLNKIMPQAIEIGMLRQQGLSEDAIAERIGIGRKTYAYRLKKVAEILKKDFPDFFENF